MTTNIYPKTTFAGDALFGACLGKEVVMTIDQLGTDTYKLWQCDMYHLIVEDSEGIYLLVAKNAIIAVEAPDTALPELSVNITEGVKQIQYKASHKRLQSNKHKNKKDYSRIPVRPMVAHEAAATSREVQIQYKAKRLP